MKLHGNAGGGRLCGTDEAWGALISYFAKAAKDLGRNTVAVARRRATLSAVTDVAAVHIGKMTGRPYDTEGPHFVRGLEL